METAKPAKCQCIAIVVLAFTTIGCLAALIIIATTQPEVRQDAKQVVRIGDVTELHAESQNFSMMTSVVQGITLFVLVAIIVASKHYADKRNHAASLDCHTALEAGQKTIIREMKK